MSGKTLHDRYVAALLARGERVIKQTARYTVVSRTALLLSRGDCPATFYYVGRAGAVRVGPKVSETMACSDAFKARLLEPVS